MLRRSTKIQLIAFIAITLLGIAYVSASYIGLTKKLFPGGACTLHAEFPDSGGIFTDAEVTYLGVTIGKVGTLHLIKNGVRVDLDIDDCNNPKIPVAGTTATIADRSVVGEQYVNLVRPKPTTSLTKAQPSIAGPYLKDGADLPMKDKAGNLLNHIPTATTTLLENLDGLVNSVNLDSLRTTVDELYNAFNGTGPDLGHLLDATDALLKSALEPQNLQNTIALIQDSAQVLQTQLDLKQPLDSWTHSLNLLSQQLKASDPDIRHLLDTAPTDLTTVTNLIQDNRTDLGVVLANLDTTGQMLVRHLPGIEQVLELYPALAAGGSTVLHDRQGALGLVLQTTPVPQDCGDPNQSRQGYNGVKRLPNDTSPAAPNVAARCTAPTSSGTNIRGSANVPGGDPISISGGGVAYPRALTQNVSNHLLQPSTLGDGSWLTIFTSGISK